MQSLVEIIDAYFTDMRLPWLFFSCLLFAVAAPLHHAFSASSSPWTGPPRFLLAIVFLQGAALLSLGALGTLLSLYAPDHFAAWRAAYFDQNILTAADIAQAIAHAMPSAFAIASLVYACGRGSRRIVFIVLGITTPFVLLGLFIIAMLYVACSWGDCL